ncbi:MAG: hypothetical protein ACR5K7_04095 [Symbiopectobacterium sp.]
MGSTWGSDRPGAYVSCRQTGGDLQQPPNLVIKLTEFYLDLEMKPVLLLLGDNNAWYVND